MATPRPGSATAKDPPSPTLLDATLDAEAHGHPLSPHEGALVRGTIVGRYVVMSRLGAGGMGVVYGAYDPELERRVALKLLHTDLAASDVSEGRRRLLREAQALAKLSHPNVVAVHDVGTLGTRVWLAMEFVEGQTLGAWRKHTPRGWREVIDTLRPAGEGLAAAHEVGLVHRDFKPDNVMVSDAGRVRVMDFGLARSGTSRAVEEDSGAHSPTDTSNQELSQAGTVIGTPPYMAPEQHLGLPADARSDQFAFCVTLWECLWGERPFRGDTVATVASAIIHGEIAEPPRGHDVPTWLRRICQRGLAADPAHRFASMGELLGAIEHGRRQTQRRRWIVGLGVCAAVPVLLYGWNELAERRRAEGCVELGAQIDAVWNDDVRARSSASFGATGLAYADDVAARTHAAIDDRVARWRGARVQSCLARDVAARDLDARADECLDEHRLELAAIVDRVVSVDVAMVPVATQAVTALPRVELCLDPGHLAQRPALPEGDRATIEEARERLATSNAPGRAGSYDASLLAAREGLALAETTQWRPLVADARRRVGGALEQLAQYDAARELLIPAYVEAAAIDAHEIAAEAALALVGIGIESNELAGAEVWSYAAEVEITLAEQGHEGPRWAVLLSRRGALALERGDLVRSRELQEESLALREALFGPDSGEANEARDQLAAALHAMGDFPGSRALYQRTLEYSEAVLGSEHPGVATRLSNLGVLMLEMGDPATARELHERALAIRERTLGRDHLEVAHSLHNLSNCLSMTGEHTRAQALRHRALAIAEASVGKEHMLVASILTDIGVDELNQRDIAGSRASLARALQITEQALGTEHPSIVTISLNLANVESESGNYPAAITLLRRALGLAEQRLGAEHPVIGAIENNLGTAVMRSGDPAGAKPHYQRALEVWGKALGPDHPNLAFALAGLGDVALAQDDPKSAVAPFERALALRERNNALPTDMADARIGLARARFDLGLDTADVARAQIERARAEYASAQNTEGVALADAWLAAHAG